MCKFCSSIPDPFYDKGNSVDGRVRLWVDTRKGVPPSLEISKELYFDHWHDYFPIKFCPMCGRNLEREV